jgi:hypothetical protein
MGWDELLAVVAGGARENGTEALQQAAMKLAGFLRQAGLEPQLWAYVAQPYRLRLVGVLALIASLLYAALLLRRRPGWALVAALAAPIVILAELDFYVPIVGWIGSQPQVHVEATVPARHPAQHLILAAHLDSKTDLLDHVERAPAELLGVPVAIVMLIAAAVAMRRARRGAGATTRLSLAAAALATINGLALFASLTAGAFVTERSHGALDDGGACAVLVRLAQNLAAGEPLERTDVTVLILSGEEIGVYGSWVYAERVFSSPPARPTAVINLEFIGATRELGVFGRETFSSRSFEPDPALLALLDEVHSQRRGAPLYRFPFPAGTDARSFLAHGVRAATLFNDLPEHALPRHLHSSWDRRERIDAASLDEALGYLQEAVRLVDRRGL